MHSKTLILMILILHLTACTQQEQVVEPSPTEQQTAIPAISIASPTVLLLPTATSTPAVTSSPPPTATSAPAPTVFKTPNPNEIVEQLVAAGRLATRILTEVSVQTVFEGEETGLVMLMEQWTDGASMRRHVLYEGHDRQKASLIDVTDGNQVWRYEADDNSYTEFTLSDQAPLNLPISSNPNIIEQMFQQLGSEG